MLRMFEMVDRDLCLPFGKDSYFNCASYFPHISLSPSTNRSWEVGLGIVGTPLPPGGFQYQLYSQGCCPATALIIQHRLELNEFPVSFGCHLPHPMQLE